MDISDDEQIIELYFNRDEQAIRLTEQKYKRLCRRISENILNDPQDCEECINDVLLRVWNTVPPTRPKNFKAFICRIARNIALTRYRFNTRKKRSAETETSLDELGEFIPDERLDSALEDKEIGEAVDRFLDTLNENARNVFLRKYWYFDSVRDIMERYGFSEGKVNNILYSTRNKLRDYLKKEGIYL